jgi:hypothetical protein
MPIQNITPRNLSQIADISRNYTPALEKKISTNTGVVSFDGAGNVNAFALYRTNYKRGIFIFEIDGAESGVMDIVNYFMDRMSRGNIARDNLFIEVPINRSDMLNVLKKIKHGTEQMFGFSAHGDNVIATYPPKNELPPGYSFKQFMDKSQKKSTPQEPTGGNDDEYGLFKDMPWKDK